MRFKLCYIFKKIQSKYAFVKKLVMTIGSITVRFVSLFCKINRRFETHKLLNSLMRLCFLSKIPIRFKKTLKVFVVFLCSLNKIFKRYEACFVAVKGVKQLINLLRWNFQENLQDSMERLSLKTTGITVKLLKEEKFIENLKFWRFLTDLSTFRTIFTFLKTLRKYCQKLKHF